tara:strand:+ start:109 stop:651 length:543 start_codon:yes stop_codon:yes gene_type:complete
MIKILSILLLCISCDNNDIKTYRIAKAPANPKAIQPPTVTDNNLQWDLPKGWVASSGSSMRLASYNVPHSNGVGDLSVMILAGDGGGVEANINRWRGQINLSPQTLSQINGQSENRENSLSSYQIFTVINDKNSERAFICAIIPLEDSTVFVKLNISAYGITEIKDDFIYFCDSFRLNDA